MEISVIALVLSVVGLLGSFFLIGFVPSLIALILNIHLVLGEKTIDRVRALAISLAGVLLPAVMYVNTFGIGLPEGEHPFRRIIHENYANFGINIFDDEKAGSTDAEDAAFQDAGDVQITEAAGVQSSDELIMYENGVALGDENQDKTDASDVERTKEEGIFESLQSIDSNRNKPADDKEIAPSDDDMPSYGGLPVGTMLVAQYFREDVHNCNPVLVLRNRTGQDTRFECRFTARDPEGEEIAISEKTVEVVRDGSLFVFEGRFDKRDLGGRIPDSYEFLVSKRDPYEKDMSDDVTVYTSIEGSSATLTADNPSDKRVKIDAYVLFFDGAELVDCMWMIPRTTDEVCLDPGTMASIKGDSYYRFDRVETYYTAYEAVGE